jgi:hypothetical protein
MNGHEQNTKENKELKTEIIFMSFAPLFALMALKYWNVCTYYEYWKKFFEHGRLIGWFETIWETFNCGVFWNFFVFIFSIILFLLALLIYSAFKNIQNNGHASYGEVLDEVEYENDVGLNYFVSFVLPLLLDDVDSFWNFMVLVGLQCIIFRLLIKSDLFYQNPVLTMLGYKTFKFRLEYQYGIEEGLNERQYIGITKEVRLNKGMVIKRKYIAGNVFLVKKS